MVGFPNKSGFLILWEMLVVYQSVEFSVWSNEKGYLYINHALLEY